MCGIGLCVWSKCVCGLGVCGLVVCVGGSRCVLWSGCMCGLGLCVCGGSRWVYRDWCVDTLQTARLDPLLFGWSYSLPRPGSSLLFGWVYPFTRPGPVGCEAEPVVQTAADLRGCGGRGWGASRAGGGDVSAPPVTAAMPRPPLGMPCEEQGAEVSAKVPLGCWFIVTVRMPRHCVGVSRGDRSCGWYDDGGGGWGGPGTLSQPNYNDVISCLKLLSRPSQLSLFCIVISSPLPLQLPLSHSLCRSPVISLSHPLFLSLSPFSALSPTLSFSLSPSLALFPPLLSSLPLPFSKHSLSLPSSLSLSLSCPLYFSNLKNGLYHDCLGNV